MAGTVVIVEMTGKAAAVRAARAEIVVSLVVAMMTMVTMVMMAAVVVVVIPAGYYAHHFLLVPFPKLNVGAAMSTIAPHFQTAEAAPLPANTLCTPFTAERGRTPRTFGKTTSCPRC